MHKNFYKNALSDSHVSGLKNLNDGGYSSIMIEISIETVKPTDM